jgi:hypothetical protein
MTFSGFMARWLVAVPLVAAAAFLAVMLAPVQAQKSNEPTAEYMTRARALAEAVDIAVKIAVVRPGELTGDEIEFWRVHVKKKALAPEPPFANFESLAYLEETFFTYWNEAEGEHVERFWRLLAERGLPFRRRDVVREVLERGNIRDYLERQHVIDGLVILQQTGKISRQEADRLSLMLKQFDEREGKRP